MERANSLAPKEQPAGLGQPFTIIECETCESLGFTHLDYAEVEAILCDGSVSRNCHVCGKKTMWKRVDYLTWQSGPGLA
jgi:hypothetical protein